MIGFTYLCACAHIFTIDKLYPIDRVVVCPKCHKRRAHSWIQTPVVWKETLMHDECKELMRHFVTKYIKGGESVVDVGSGDVNGTFRPLFGSCKYTGVDLGEGENVDRVVEAYDWGDPEYDVLISGNCLEHVPDTVAWVEESLRICKPGGLICVVTPHSWPEHKFPVDCYRFFPDGLRWHYRTVNVLECWAGPFDTILIARNEPAE